MLKTRTRKIVALLVLIFVLYSIYTAPNRSADTAHAGLNVLETAVARIFDFFGALINR